MDFGGSPVERYPTNLGQSKSYAYDLFGGRFSTNPYSAYKRETAIYNPSARTQTMFFCSLEGGILEETSGRRHLGGFRRLSGSSLGNSLGAGAAMGASRASWTENASDSLCFTAKTIKTYHFA